MKIAIIHDWLVNYAGSERVLAEIIACYPDADVFSVVDFLSDEDRAKLHNISTTNTFIQRLPFARKKYRAYLSLMPLAIEQIDLSGYELVISSSHAVAKGVLISPDQVHISYVHTPIRYAWDLQHQYLRESGLKHGLKSLIARWQLHKIRLWDLRTVNGVDSFVANSSYIARRIYKLYRRESTVIHPPVDIDYYSYHNEKEDFYLAASRLVPYKKMLLIVNAFKRMPDKKLVVIGDGPGRSAIESNLTDNIKYLGWCDNDMLKHYMQRARAFVFAAEEDFGIVPVEAQACGTPVIAFGKGGVLDTVIDGETGILFDSQEESAIIEAVNRFEAISGEINGERCRANAERFSSQVFRKRFAEHVEQAVNEWQARIWK